MHQCCVDSYDLEFDEEHAQNDLQHYKLIGLKKNSRPLVHLLGRLDLLGMNLLDIGGGVGTVTFELFKEGIKSAIHIDISSAHVRAFREESANRSLSDQTTSYVGDFMDLHEKIDQVDIVTLDKVICCYLNYEDLIRLSLKKAIKWYAFVIPRDIWWVKLVHYIETKWRKLRGKHFETYIHPISQIESIIKEEGFHLHQESFQREWYYAIYKK